jgi:threonine dehydrogenase-like Zn-dependent dehydrogenase
VLSINAFPIFRKGLRILSSFTSVRNSIQAVRLLASGRIDVEPLISHRMPLSQLEHGIELMETGRDGVMKVHIQP